MRWRVTKSKDRLFARRTSTNANVLFLWSDLGASFHRRKRPASGGVADPHWFAFRQEAEKGFWLSSRAKRGNCFLPDRKENTYSLERAYVNRVEEAKMK